MEQKQYKTRARYRVNMPKKLGLLSGEKYIFTETDNGYTCRIIQLEWIGMPKSIIENNPKL